MKRHPHPPVAVVGIGAIGGLIAARLIRSGYPILSVGRDSRWLSRVRRQGLRISGRGYGFGTILTSRQLHPVVQPKGPICSAVILCVKSGDTATAISKIRSLVGPQTAVLSLQNGLTHMKLIRRAFGGSRTVFGVTLVAANRPEPLHIRHEAGEDIWLAPHPGNTQALNQVKDMLLRCRWKTRVVAPEDRLLWTKVVFNGATNPIGALTNHTNGDLIRIPALRELVLRALREAADAASKAGHSPLYSYAATRRLLINKGDAPNQPNSMLQDIRAGRKTELDAILGPLIRTANSRKRPVLQSLYRFTRRLEKELGRT